MHPLLDPSRRVVVGHRGNAAHAPENTLESFRQAIAARVDALEFDVHLSGDGSVVVIHDPTLERTTSATGRVDALSLDEIRRADAGARFTPDGGATWPYRGLGVAVPTLVEVLEALPPVALLIEIKTPAAAVPVRTLIERFAATDRCIVASFEHEALVPFRGSRIRTASTRRDAARLLLPALLRMGWARGHVGFDAMCIPRSHNGLPLPVTGYVRLLRPLGVPVHVWTVDDPAVARALWDMGVSGIISNDPAAILRARARADDHSSQRDRVTPADPL